MERNLRVDEAAAKLDVAASAFVADFLEKPAKQIPLSNIDRAVGVVSQAVLATS